MTDATRLLTELMLNAEVFCSRVEALQDIPLCDRPLHEAPPQNAANGELTLKIAQCRGAVSQLQEYYEEDKLDIKHKPTLAVFRHLMMSLMWVSFYGKRSIDFRLFRKVVQIESGFTFLLLKQLSGEQEN